MRATVSPSEDPQKVLGAMGQVFGNCEYVVDEGPSSIRVRSTSPRCLQRLRDQLRDRHVRDAARRLMLASLEGNVLPLRLNRQAAVVGVLALCSNAVESPLGPINLEVETEAPQKLIDWLTFY